MDSKRKRQARPEVESLEDRSLLAVDVTLSGKVLTITGTDGADKVRVFTRRDKLVVEVTPDASSTPVTGSTTTAGTAGTQPQQPEQHAFNRGHVKTILFDGKGGDD